MMVRSLPLVLPLIAAASAGLAQEVLVRTAEHDGFTRIVVDFTERPAWQLGRAGSDYELRTNAPSVSYDLGDIYRRIYSGRLVALEGVAPGNLGLKTGCDCHLRTEELANGGLVIDIRDGTPKPGDRYEIALGPEPRRSAPPVPAPYRNDPGPSPALPVAFPSAPAMTAPHVLPLNPDEQIGDAANQLQAGIVEEIRRAADLDLVELKPDVRFPMPPAKDQGQATEPVHTDREESAEAEPERRTARPNARIRTETEIVLEEQGATPDAVDADPAICAGIEELLRPADWAAEGPGPGGIRLNREQLVDLLGAPSAGGFENLVESYLYLSFGREAEAAISAAPPYLPNRDIYLALARLVDGRSLQRNPLSGLASCPGNTGLWAWLAEPASGATSADETQPLAFADWPDHLRRALGPRLVEAYLNAGAREPALAIFHAIARVSTPGDPALLMLAARFADEDESGQTDLDSSLEHVASTRAPESVPALLDVIEARIEEDVTVGSDLAMQAGALAFELGSGTDSQKLRGAEIRALIHDGHYRAAVERLDQVAPQEDHDALLDFLVKEMAAHAGDGDLLWIAARLEGVGGITREARRALAGRVVALGLPDLARTSLGLGVALPTRDDRRLLARIALLEDRPDTAEAYLAGLSTPEDERLREEIARIRQQESVFTTLQGAEDPDPSEAAVSAARPEVAIDEIGLERGRTLLAESESLRREVQEILRP